MQYWENLRGARLAPVRTEIDPASIPRLLQHICLIDSINDGADFRFRLMGTHVVDNYGEELRGKLLSELPDSPFRDACSDVWQSLIARQGPVHYGPVQTVLADRPAHMTEHVDFPLSSDGNKLDMILAGVVMLPERDWQRALTRPADAV